MKRFSKILPGVIAALPILFFLLAAAPRTGTVSDTTTHFSDGYQITKITWAADSTGAVKTTATTAFIRGVISQIVTKPDTSLVPATEDSSGRYPTDNYDLTLKNADSLDVAGGQLANRDTQNGEGISPLILYSTVSTNTTESHTYSLPMPVPFFNNSKLTMALTNNKIPNARGYIYIFWQEK